MFKRKLMRCLLHLFFNNLENNFEHERIRISGFSAVRIFGVLKGKCMCFEHKTDGTPECWQAFRKETRQLERRSVRRWLSEDF